MRRLLYEGGAQYYASFGDESMPVGAVVSNRGRQAASVTVRAVVRDAGGRQVWSHRFDVEVAPGDARTVEAPCPIAADASDPLSVEVSLERDGRRLDRLQHQVRIWRAKDDPQFVRARRGDFYLGGTKWYAHGVNYMPSSGVAIEDREYFEYWLDPQPYDPEVIERDLADLESIGLNMVSPFVYHRSLASRNLLDLLIRCEEHGLKVNLSLRPGTPMHFLWDQMREIVTTCRLAENDTVMAYDLAWEPLWGKRARRRQYDPLWRAWVAQRYGSVAKAEAAWHVSAPRENGRLAGPSDQQVSADGPWREMVIDYRRFLGDLLHERYGRARRLMRSIDPNHLVSFRMTVAGDPTYPPANMSYELAGLARAVDLMEPEGYGRIGDWQAVRPGWFTVAYSRAVAPELPVMWAEFGVSVWNGTTAAASREQLAFAGRFYEDFYRMAYRSGANGTVAWFSPGGYRYNERSDYGIINPDRSWRPTTHVMHLWAQRMTTARPLPKPDVWIPIELYRDVEGLPGIYRRTREAFWKAVEAGRTPGLKIISGRPASTGD